MRLNNSFMPSYVKPSPCPDCNDRWVNANGRCHTTCERFAEWRAEVERAKLKHDACVNAQNDVDSYVVSVKRKIRRRKK